MKAPKVKPSELLRLLNEQGHRCALTGRELTPQNASLDHVLAVKNGGAHDIQNVQLVIKQANRMKGTMTMEEFVSICTDVAKNHGNL